jgi:hypothetical protein
MLYLKYNAKGEKSKATAVLKIGDNRAGILKNTTAVLKIGDSRAFCEKWDFGV